ncbi:hypothetical protein AnigIFM63604_004103 [Aspergillus niger]|uniref:Uncharacterized protein n=1 Tax=Aspergillus niger TaxID=5061 RepID=A0A9W6ACX7_ASPNG|nr:hypothetical protein AnigIFM63604_004103 [Aspergillus niger]
MSVADKGAHSIVPRELRDVLDGVISIAAFARAPPPDSPVRAQGSTRVYVHDGISAGSPFGGIRGFESFKARKHPLRHPDVSWYQVQGEKSGAGLAVWALDHQGGNARFRRQMGPKYVRAYHGAVV